MTGEKPMPPEAENGLPPEAGSGLPPEAGSGRPLVKAMRVAKAFGGKPVLADVSCSLHPGTVTLFSAPSGSGKSTLLEILAGVQAPDRGAVERSCPASLMFQDNALVPNLDAEGNLAYILPPSMPKAERAEKIASWLKLFELEHRVYPRSMSSGMKRRLNLARALIAGRAVTLLDEPFAFLDERWHGVVAGLILAKASAGGAVALAGHEPAPALVKACGGLLRVLELGAPPVILKDAGGKAQEDAGENAPEGSTGKHSEDDGGKHPADDGGKGPENNGGGRNPQGTCDL
ncbi:MAG: ATP-binding cassette domain-containing protein [Deltaproteobacteria bacterium]|jgi:ABC-type nitrate/sulfonate/bicarbonate transport system ATPase subunit|nr:ATP-binding cassette domain-containing protein [Deltaproteobacteria bacterium]